MVGNVKTVIGQPDAVPAHLVDQVLPDDHDLLTAVLDSKRTTLRLKDILPQMLNVFSSFIYFLPAGVRCKHRERHPLSEVFCDVLRQWRPGNEETPM